MEEEEGGRGNSSGLSTGKRKEGGIVEGSKIGVQNKIMADFNTQGCKHLGINVFVIKDRKSVV